MPAGTISNDTASTATSKALEGIVTNLNELADASPKLRALLAPSEKVLGELHRFATSEKVLDDSRSAIGDGFHEFGIQVADALRSLYKSSKSGFKGIFQRAENYSSKLKRLFSTKKTSNKDSAPERTILSLIKYSADHENEIASRTKSGSPAITFKTKQGPGKPDLVVSVSEPQKLFEYINLAYRRNKILGKPIDNKIKGLILIAHCIREDIKADGKIAIDRTAAAEAVNLKPRSLRSEAEKWNQALLRGTKPSAINDYFSPITNQGIEKRDSVIEENNNSGHKKIDTLKKPNLLLQFLTITKKMQAIKLFIDNKKAEDQTTNFKSLDIVMQWYIQLGNASPEISLTNFARNEYGISSETDLLNIKRIKSMWNRGKLTV